MCSSFSSSSCARRSVRSAATPRPTNARESLRLARRAAAAAPGVVDAVDDGHEPVLLLRFDVHVTDSGHLDHHIILTIVRRRQPIKERLGGRALRWDPETHTVIDDPEANRLLSRPYAAPWNHPTPETI